MSGWNTDPNDSGDGDWGTPAKTATLNGWDVSGNAPSGDSIDEAQAEVAATATYVRPPKFERVTGWVEPQGYNYDELSRRPEAGSYDGSAQVYEWDGEMGDVGPEHPELEVQLFGDPNDRTFRGHGDDFTMSVHCSFIYQNSRANLVLHSLTEIELHQEGPARVQPIHKFSDAGLHPVMLRNVELSGYAMPTTIQKYALPAIAMGYDVIAIAQTGQSFWNVVLVGLRFLTITPGSGKTAAFLIPILNKLMGKAKQLAAPRPNPVTYRVGIDAPVRAEPLVVIVCPSRELAVQIFNEARKFCYRTMLRPCVVYGGGPIGEQIAQLSKGCDILIASPGRLIDFLNRPHVLTFRRLRYMVIDEADEMLHEEWQEDFSKILNGGDQDEEKVRYMLFSATFPKPIRELANTHLAETHVRLRVGRAGSSHANIKQKIIYVEPAMKKQCIYDLLKSLPASRTIIFVNNRRKADELDDFLFNLGVPCTSIHSDRTQIEREAAMRAFRRGESPVLVATAVTARGIDVRNVMHVINYDLPSIDYGGIDEYVHRIGRTARIGFRGLASSLYTDRDEPMASLLTKTLLETNQEVPHFLQSYIPEGWSAEKKLADEDFEEQDVKPGGGESWGAAGDAAGGGWGDGTDASTAAPVAPFGWDAEPSINKTASSDSGW